MTRAASSLAATLSACLERLGWPQLLALGEPTHGEPRFPQLRNRIFEVLVDHGFRSIAVESDAVRALAVDAYVRGEGGTLDEAMAGGFSHGFGQLAANRELVTWMRGQNQTRPAAQRLAFHGIDAPLEMSAAPSPRPYLEHVHGYLARHLGPDALLHRRAEIDALLGEDGRWSDPAAQVDATRSVGASAEAQALRVVADDLLTALHAHAPRLVAASSLTTWDQARVHGGAGLGLLRYHAQAAEAVAPAERMSRMLGVRDAVIAQNLLAVRVHEQHRGPTLVFAHNRHLQRHTSTWRLADMDLEWAGAGAIVATLLGDRYAFVAGSLGASGALGLAAPGPDTFEGALPAAGGLVDGPQLAAVRGARARTDVVPEQGYFPLDAVTLAGCDAVLHVSSPAGPTPDVVAMRILGLPGVACVVAEEASGAPEVSWGDRFFYAGADRRRPFATIVEHDVPGFDESSRLDRPGVFRLSIELGRAGFEREFGYPPKELPERLPGIDAARLDEVLPHPAYGTAGWASVLNPSTRLPDAVRLLVRAHQRALERRVARRSSSSEG